MIIYKENYIPLEDDVKTLYSTANWLAYTNNMPITMAGLANSKLITAYDGTKLIGLIRAISDNATILYIQDLIVDPTYHRRGIGKTLMTMLIDQYPTIRQKVLLTDASAETTSIREFYRKLGFTTCDQGEVVAMARFDKIHEQKE